MQYSVDALTYTATVFPSSLDDLTQLNKLITELHHTKGVSYFKIHIPSIPEANLNALQHSLRNVSALDIQFFVSNYECRTIPNEVIL